MMGKRIQRKEKRKVKSIGWEKNITSHSPQMASGARVSLMMGKSASCKDTTHFWRKRSVFFPEEMDTELTV